MEDVLSLRQWFVELFGPRWGRLLWLLFGLLIVVAAILAAIAGISAVLRPTKPVPTVSAPANASSPANDSVLPELKPDLPSRSSNGSETLTPTKPPNSARPPPPSSSATAPVQNETGNITGNSGIVTQGQTGNNTIER